MAIALLSFLQLEIETCEFIFDTNYCALSIISEAIDTIDSIVRYYYCGM